MRGETRERERERETGVELSFCWCLYVLLMQTSRLPFPLFYCISFSFSLFPYHHPPHHDLLLFSSLTTAPQHRNSSRDQNTMQIVISYDLSLSLSLNIPRLVYVKIKEELINNNYKNYLYYRMFVNSEHVMNVYTEILSLIHYRNFDGKKGKSRVHSGLFVFVLIRSDREELIPRTLELTVATGLHICI